MKFIKLFIIAVVFVGGFFLLKWAFASKSTDDYDDFSGSLSPELEEYKNQWEREAQWDSTLFYTQISQVNDKRRLGKIGESTKENQIRQIHFLARDVICDTLTSLYRSEHYNDSAINANLKGLDVLKRHVDLSNDSRIDTMIKVNEQYGNVMRHCRDVSGWGDKAYTNRMKFNSGNLKAECTWIPYADIAAADVDSIKSRTDYNVYFANYLSNNIDLREVINSAYANIPNHKTAYYNAVKDEIVNAYNGARPKIEEGNYKTDANKIRQQYRDGSITIQKCNSQLDELKNYYDAYKQRQEAEHQALKDGLEETVTKYKNEYRSHNGLDGSNGYIVNFNKKLVEPFPPSNVFKHPD